MSVRSCAMLCDLAFSRAAPLTTSTPSRHGRALSRQLTKRMVTTRPARSGVDAEHDADILHRYTRSALTEDVEPRDEHRVAMSLIAEDAQLKQIRVVESKGIEPPGLRRLSVR